MLSGRDRDNTVGGLTSTVKISDPIFKVEPSFQASLLVRLEQTGSPLNQRLAFPPPLSPVSLQSALLFAFFVFFLQESSILVNALDKISPLLRYIFRCFSSNVNEMVKFSSSSTFLTTTLGILDAK